MIKTHYDPEADAFAAWFGPGGTKAVDSQEVAPGVVLDFDESGTVIGVEVLDVRARIAGRYPAKAEKLAAAE
jgi:uncharacterized protein YuzE